jgi:two-component system, OmpR family, sensor kinase
MRSALRIPDLSLRARLLALLVVLAAAGLLVVAAVSYRALDSYLINRTDQQLEEAVGPVAHRLLAENSGLETPLAGPGGGPDLGPGTQLPPGTFGQLRNPEGKVVARVVLGYNSKAPRPALPHDLGGGTAGGRSAAFTVGSRGGGSTEFRALAAYGPDGSSIVVAIPLSDVAATLDRLALIELIVSGAVLLALAIAAWWMVGLGLRPLRRMGDVAGQIAAGDLSRRVEPANPRTEVGRLGIALNAMLGQIEDAFARLAASEERMRRFLADASHELRTPLAAIRGYSELHRLGVDREPERVDRAMDRIEAEATRMGALVDDLLTLARVDESDAARSTVRERVELRGLLGELRDDVGATAPDRQISLLAPDAIEVSGDPEQLRRVFLNLLRNAVVHTPPGTAIDVSLAGEGDGAVIRVRDHGPGLPPGGPEAVFERFWRGSSSRGRDDGGAGLGLAIVAALVEAHGGTVAAANVPGEDGRPAGAEFTVRLPAAG